MDSILIAMLRFVINLITIVCLILIFFMIGRYGSCARAEYWDWDNPAQSETDNGDVGDNSVTPSSSVTDDNSVFGGNSDSDSNSDTSDNSVSNGNGVSVGYIVPTGMTCGNNTCCVTGSTRSCRSIIRLKLV